jgi:hypothetical protein
MNGLVDRLAVAGRYRNLDRYRLLHRKLNNLWHRGADSHALPVGELNCLKIRGKNTGGADYLTRAEDLLRLLPSCERHCRNEESLLAIDGDRLHGLHHVVRQILSCGGADQLSALLLQ